MVDRVDWDNLRGATLHNETYPEYSAGNPIPLKNFENWKLNLTEQQAVMMISKGSCRDCPVYRECQQPKHHPRKQLECIEKITGWFDRYE